MATAYFYPPPKYTGDWYDYPRQRIIESYQQDNYGEHHLVDDPEKADVIIIASNHNFAPLGLGILFESVFRKYASKCVVIESGDYPSPVIGGLCASWKRSDCASNLALGWCYHHPGAAEPKLVRQPMLLSNRYLWSFIGSKSTHPIREMLFKIKHNRAFVQDTSATSLPNLRRITSPAAQAEFTNTFEKVLAESAFVVCPRGLGPSSMRIFEAMRAGRAPVIISDEWTAPPFIDWDKCSLRIPECATGSITEILQQQENSAERLGNFAYQEWERVLGPNGLFHYTVTASLQLLDKRPYTFSIQRARRYGLLIQEPWRRHMLRWLKNTMVAKIRS